MSRWIVICLVALIASYLIWPGIFPDKKYKPDQALIDRIDSLERSNLELREGILYLDSVQTSLTQQLSEVDGKIANVQGKTTIIKQIYKEKSDNVRQITKPTQVDSFFKDRYNY